MQNIKSEVYFPLYHEEQCIERDKIREEVLNKDWNESHNYALAFDNWTKWNKLPHSKEWKFIILNGNIAWIWDEIKFNLRFWEEAIWIIKEIRTFWFQWEYSLIIDTPQIVKDKYWYDSEIMEIWREYSPSLTNYKICYNTYLDNIVPLEDPYKFEKIQWEVYYNDTVWQSKYN